VVVVCALLLKRDLDARDKQMARLGREEALAKLALSLANGKRTRMGWVDWPQRAAAGDVACLCTLTLSLLGRVDRHRVSRRDIGVD